MDLAIYLERIISDLTAARDKGPTAAVRDGAERRSLD
jgi:hypothetical protein